MAEIDKLPEEEKINIMDLPISYEEKGKEIGKEIGKKEVAVEMLKKGLDMELISDVTHLKLDEIKKLKDEL